MSVEEEIAGDVSNKHNGSVQDKKIWKSLRSHIMYLRKKNKQDEIDAEMIRKKKCVEFQKKEENKLSLAQINGRLTQLRGRREELEGEKITLINQMRDVDHLQQALCDLVNKPLPKNNNNNTTSFNYRSVALFQHQNILRQNTLSGARSPVPGSGSSPLIQHSLMLNSSINNTGSNNQTLLVCSPVTGNGQNNVTRPSTSSNTFMKFSTLYSNNTTHLSPNVGTVNKMGRTPSPNNQQNYQPSQIISPFPTYKPMNNAGNNINNLNSAIVAPIINNMNQNQNNSYSIDNANRRIGRDEPVHLRNVWITNDNSSINKNTQPNVSNYGSFYQSNSNNAVNYCVNGVSTSVPSVNTVFSYSGPPPQSLQRTDSSNGSNLMATSVENRAQHQTSKPIISQHPPMYTSPGIRVQPNNRGYHSKPPHSGVYLDKSPPSNYYQHHGIRNIHSSNTTTTISSQSYQMSQKPHTIGYPIRHSIALSQLSPAIQSSKHTTYNVPTCVVTGYPNKSSANNNPSTGENPRYQPPTSRHE